ncbi:MAG: flagellar biosynthetic protein FliO [Ignavibacteriales bacterium]|nr:flagellar biosynthetic protein FliO [Ignavibacteriales bacterium]
MNLWDFIKIFLVLIMLAGLMYFMLHLLKKYFYSVESKHPKLISIKVLANQMLMPKKFLSIVKVQDKFYLLGISDQSVNLIDKFEDPELKLKLEAGSVPSTVNFLDYFKKSLDKK